MVNCLNYFISIKNLSKYKKWKDFYNVYLTTAYQSNWTVLYNCINNVNRMSGSLPDLPSVLPPIWGKLKRN